MRITLLADDDASGRRLQEMARALAAAGHRTTVVGGPYLSTAATTADRPPWRRSDAVIASPWGAAARALVQRHLLVADGTRIRPVELWAFNDKNPKVRHTIRSAERWAGWVASRADAVLVASEAQRRWWQSVAGDRSVPLIDLPGGIPGDDPAPKHHPLPGVPPGWSVILWWGDASPWFDIDALFAARAALGGTTVSVVVVPQTEAVEGFQSSEADRLRHRARSLSLGPPQVVVLDSPVACERRHELLGRAAVLAMLHHPGPTAELASPAAALDAVWSETPLVVTEGGETARLTRDRGWGAVVPPSDDRATAAALDLLLSGRAADRCRRALREDQPSWTWERVVAPLNDSLARLPKTPRRGLARSWVHSMSTPARIERWRS